MELEFIVLKLAGNEAGWLRNFLENISLAIKPMSYVVMLCDHQITTIIILNKIFNCKNRYTHLKYDVTKLLIKDIIISIDYVSLTCELC